MDGQTSVTEMDKEGFYEMDGHRKCQKMEMTLKWIKL